MNKTTLTEDAISLYPTIEDKIVLFKQNGIPAEDYYRITWAAGGSEKRPQIIRFHGDEATAQLAVEVAIQYDLPVIKLTHEQDYSGFSPIEEPYWTLQFRQRRISN